MENGKVRFIRKNGRIIPVKGKQAEKVSKDKQYTPVRDAYVLEKGRKNTAGERFSKGTGTGMRVGTAVGLGMSFGTGLKNMAAAGIAGAIWGSIIGGAASAAFGSRHNQKLVKLQNFKKKKSSV